MAQGSVKNAMEKRLLHVQLVTDSDINTIPQWKVRREWIAQYVSKEKRNVTTVAVAEDVFSVVTPVSVSIVKVKADTTNKINLPIIQTNC